MKRYKLEGKASKLFQAADAFEDLAIALEGWERGPTRDNRIANSLLKVRAALEAIEGALSLAPKSEPKPEEKSNPKSEEVKP